MHIERGFNNFSLIVFAFAVIFAVGTIALTLRLQLRLRRRAGLNRSEFVAAMPVAGMDVAEDVFDEYRKESFASSFKLSPDCDLRKVFTQESDDIFDTAKRIAVKRGLRSPNETDLRNIAAKEGFTAKDLVEMLTSLGSKEQ